MNKRFDEAVAFATAAHSGQTRKMQNIPYILHPMEVAAIASTMTECEEILMAALLHDTVEDCGVAMETITEKFGPRVAALVDSETEKRDESQTMEQSWKERKASSLEELRDATDIGAKILWLSDKLANMRTFYNRWLKEGDEAFNLFHQKDKTEQRWYYQTVADYVPELAETTAYAEYTAIIRKIFDGEE